MKLHSPPFERALRDAVRRAVKSSPALKRESLRSNCFRHHYRVAWLLRLALSLGFASLIWWVADRTQHVASALAVMSLWFLIGVFFQVQSLRGYLYASDDLPALALLPISETRIFHWELRKFRRRSFLTFMDFLAGMGTLAWFSDLPAGRWLFLPPIAVLIWMTTLALVFLLAAFLPRLPYRMAWNGAILAGVAIFVSRDLIGEKLVVFLDRCAPVINVVLPTGWTASLFELLTAKGSGSNLGLLIPIGVLIATAKYSLKKLRTDYELIQCARVEPLVLVPGPEAILPSVGVAPDGQPPNCGATAIEEIVLSRKFLISPAWPRRGRLDRLLWRWFNPREKVLAEFVFPAGFPIHEPWRKIAGSLFWGSIIAYAAGFVNTTLADWILGIGVFISCILVLGQIIGTGRAFEGMSNNGVEIPRYAGFAVGVRELGRFYAKCSLVQLPLFVAFTMTCGLLIAYYAGGPLKYGMWCGFKAGCLLPSARFVTLALAFSSGTNDSSGLRVLSLMVLTLIVGCGGLFLLLAGASVLVTDQLAALWLGGGAILDSYAFFRIYGWLHYAGRFDLMHLPRQ